MFAKLLAIGFLGQVDRAGAIAVLEGTNIATCLPAVYLCACLYAEDSPNRLDSIAKSISLMQSVAEKQYPPALRSLAFLLMDEKGNDADSERLIRQAAELEDPVALYWIAIKALKGSDEHSSSDAIQLLLRAANQDYAAACSFLFLIYKHGKYGVQADSTKARFFQDKASTLEPSADA